MYDCIFLFDCAFREGVCIVGSLLSRLDLGHMLRTIAKKIKSKNAPKYDIFYPIL